MTGHGKNHEAFTGFMIDNTNTLHRPLVEECWKYVTQFAQQCGDYDRNRILREIPENCSYLDATYKIKPHQICLVQEGLQAALLYNEPQSSILQQIAGLVPLKDVESLTVLSPYFDEDGETLVALSKLCPEAKINVLIQKDCALPPCKLSKNKRIVFYDFDETKRGKMGFRTYYRQLHAKIYLFKTKDSEYCVIGSANATTAGLGTLTKRGINEEFCVLYQSDEIDFLSMLGLKASKRIDVPQNRLNHSVESSTRTNNKVKLLSVQYSSELLSITCLEDLPKGLLLAVDNGADVSVFELKYGTNHRYEIETKLGNAQYISYLIDEEGNKMSNMVFVNWTELLATTNPSKTSRSLNRFISRIENQGYDGMEVADMLMDVMWDLVNEEKEKVNLKIKASSEDKRILDRSLPQIKYNPDYDNDDAKSSRTIQIDRSSRLIECIEESIKKKIRSIDDAILDEEEQGVAETSNDREVDEQEDIIISKKHIKDYGDLSTSVLKKYQKLVSKRFKQVNNTGIREITKDDLNFFSLSMFAALEICYLNRFRYQFDEIDPISRSKCQKLLYDSLDRSISIIGLDALELFVKFCASMKDSISLDESFIKVACRTMKYAILYGTLFNKTYNQIDKQVRCSRVSNAVKMLASLIGMPSIEYLSRELEPLSEKYDYAFRMRHIEVFIDKLNDINVR